MSLACPHFISTYIVLLPSAHKGSKQILCETYLCFYVRQSFRDCSSYCSPPKQQGLGTIFTSPHAQHLPSTVCYKNPELDTVFVPEVLDEYNQGVIDESGRRMSTRTVQYASRRQSVAMAVQVGIVQT
jgi:hypothetical protein